MNEPIVIVLPASYCHSHFSLTLKTVPNSELEKINHKLVELDMKLSEALTLLSTANTQLSEASTEILSEIDKLKNTDPDISPEGMAVITSISTKAAALADIVPNVPTPSPEA